MRLGEPAKMQAAINITPLVDVVLVLLIIFMVMAPQMRKGPDVNLPNTAKPSRAGRRERPDPGLHRRGRRAVDRRSAGRSRAVRRSPPRCGGRRGGSQGRDPGRRAAQLPRGPAGHARDRAGRLPRGGADRQARRRRRRENDVMQFNRGFRLRVCSPRSTSRRSSTWCSCC